MKIKSYRTLYHIFSFLSDKTNGASLFVKYKLALGIILVGFTTVSCSKDEEEDPPLMCYDATTIPQEARANDKGNIEVINIVGESEVTIVEISKLN